MDSDYLFRGHRIPEIGLTQTERQHSEYIARERIRIAKEQGWKNRHDGMKPLRAGTVGHLGEIAVQLWLGFRGIRYEATDPLVTDLRLIGQDIIVNGWGVGVKTMESETLAQAFRWDSFLYPAKKEEGYRVLDYPDVLIQVAVDFEGRSGRGLCAWLLGWTGKEQLKRGRVAPVKGAPTHKIPHGKYRDVSELVEVFKTNPASSRRTA